MTLSSLLWVCLGLWGAINCFVAFRLVRRPGRSEAQHLDEDLAIYAPDLRERAAAQPQAEQLSSVPRPPMPLVAPARSARSQ
jgi:hypothetical protein